jgi:hypothetical protein
MYDNLQVNETTLVIKVDGRDATSQFQVKKFGVSYFSATYNANLEYGQHTVDVRVEDTSHNVGTLNLYFTVTQPTGPSAAMIQDLITIAIIMIVVVVVLLVVFGRSKRKRADEE